MFDSPCDIRRSTIRIVRANAQCGFAMRSNGRRRDKGMYQEIGFGIHCNRGARKQDDPALVLGNFAVR
jgi:hypothetical protein